MAEATQGSLARIPDPGVPIGWVGTQFAQVRRSGGPEGYSGYTTGSGTLNGQ